ncbi:MAG: enoyl-CoA hydratase/isomerase family protein, partial [Pyrinomonadaceae bacterium]
SRPYKLMSKSSIIYERRDSFAIIRLYRPEKLNALSREMIKALSGAFAELEHQPELRAVILTGVGDRAFCVGTDISELSALDESEARETSRLGQALCDQIESFTVPVIAAINGLAVGGGCELALACHIRLASENAQFSLPETELGVIPGYGGTQRLAREIGRGRALEMVLTGRILTAAEAFQYGLINRVTDKSELLTEAESVAVEIAKLAPLAIRACLQAVTRGLELPLKEGLAIERELFASLFTTEDMREGTRAFLEKRLPIFKGA